MAVRPAMTPEDVERGYNNRAAVPDHPYWLDQFATRSRHAVATLSPLRDLRYGRAIVVAALDIFARHCRAHRHVSPLPQRFR